MIDLVKIDPFLCGYFENETLEHGERVGLALLCASKNLTVKFSRQLLPETAFATESGSSGYSPSDGLWFSQENILKIAEEYPEHKETLGRYVEEIKIFKDKSKLLNSEITVALNESGAHWGGGWGGHSNPDYGKIVNFGTVRNASAIRRKNALSSSLTHSSAFFNASS